MKGKLKNSVPTKKASSQTAPWTQEDMESLVNWKASGYSNDEIGKRLNRTSKSIAAKYGFIQREKNKIQSQSQSQDDDDDDNKEEEDDTDKTTTTTPVISASPTATKSLLTQFDTIHDQEEDTKKLKALNLTAGASGAVQKIAHELQLPAHKVAASMCLHLLECDSDSESLAASYLHPKVPSSSSSTTSTKKKRSKKKEDEDEDDEEEEKEEPKKKKVKKTTTTPAYRFSEAVIKFALQMYEKGANVNDMLTHFTLNKKSAQALYDKVANVAVIPSRTQSQLAAASNADTDTE